MKVLIVGKGPSAVTAPQHLDGSSVCSINDALRLFPGPVDYCFFTDLPLLERFPDQWDRVRQFVCPSMVHGHDKQPCDCQLPDGFPLDRLERYPYAAHPRDEGLYRHLVRRRQIVHHHTTTAALCWLSYHGFKHLKMVGFDGGTKLAPGMEGLMGDGFDYDSFRMAELMLARVLTKYLGVTIEWV